MMAQTTAPAVEETTEPAAAPANDADIDELKRELAEMRKLLEKIASDVEANS